MLGSRFLLMVLSLGRFCSQPIGTPKGSVFITASLTKRFYHLGCSRKQYLAYSLNFPEILLSANRNLGEKEFAYSLIDPEILLPTNQSHKKKHLDYRLFRKAISCSWPQSIQRLCSQPIIPSGARVRKEKIQENTHHPRSPPKTHLLNST